MAQVVKSGNGLLGRTIALLGVVVGAAYAARHVRQALQPLV
jgi:hypothetical protein